MKLLKKSKAQPEASSEASDLPTRIKQARAEAEAFIDAQVDAIKNGRAEDGSTLPRGLLRQMITRGERCACAVALSLIEKEN
jgi:hypothetical protein